MTDIFTFDIDESWEANLAHLKSYLDTQDCECTKILFQNLETLVSSEASNGRRDFNQLVLAALNALAEAEIAEADS